MFILPITTIVFYTRFCLLSSFPRPIFILQVGRFNPMSSLMTKDLGFHCLNYITKASTFLIIVGWNQPVFTVVMPTLIEHLVIGEHTLEWRMNKNGCGEMVRKIPSSKHIHFLCSACTPVARSPSDQEPVDFHWASFPNLSLDPPSIFHLWIYTELVFLVASSWVEGFFSVCRGWNFLQWELDETEYLTMGFGLNMISYHGNWMRQDILSWELDEPGYLTMRIGLNRISYHENWMKQDILPWELDEMGYHTMGFGWDKISYHGNWMRQDILPWELD